MKFIFRKDKQRTHISYDICLEDSDGILIDRFRLTPREFLNKTYMIIKSVVSDDKIIIDTKKGELYYNKTAKNIANAIPVIKSQMNLKKYKIINQDTYMYLDCVGLQFIIDNKHYVVPYGDTFITKVFSDESASGHDAIIYEDSILYTEISDSIIPDTDYLIFKDYLIKVTEDIKKIIVMYNRIVSL